MWVGSRCVMPGKDLVGIFFRKPDAGVVFFGFAEGHTEDTEFCAFLLSPGVVLVCVLCGLWCDPECRCNAGEGHTFIIVGNQ